MDGSTPQARSRTLAGALLSVALGPALGAVLGAGLLMVVLLPALGIGGVERINAVVTHLREPGWRHPVAVLLGNSVTVEGYDADATGRAADGWSCENLSINGGDLTEQQVLLPAVISAHPDAIVLTLRVVDLGSPPDVPIDKAYAYAASGAVARWPSGMSREDLAGLSAGAWDALRSPRWRARLSFRTVLLSSANVALRDAARREVQSAEPTNFIDPYDLRGSISGDKLRRHVADVTRGLSERTSHGTDAGARQIEAIVRDIASAGIAPVLVIAPVHPLMEPAVAPLQPTLIALLDTLRGAYGAVVVDAEGLLGQDQFADAIHPNAEGRAVLSAFLGAHLPAREGTR